VPLTVDGLIYASSMVMLDATRRKTAIPAPARWLPGLGVAATLAANVAHGLGHRPVGVALAAWRVAASAGVPAPLQEQAVEVFADHLALDRVPPVRAIRARLHVGQPQAQRPAELPRYRSEKGRESCRVSNLRKSRQNRADHRHPPVARAAPT
jgi:hypothetical protein